jgi:hypothetical protein
MPCVVNKFELNKVLCCALLWLLTSGIDSSIQRYGITDASCTHLMNASA